MGNSSYFRFDDVNTEAHKGHHYKYFFRKVFFYFRKFFFYFRKFFFYLRKVSLFPHG